MHHTVGPDSAHLHGNYTPHLRPVLEVSSGDTLTFSVPDVSWGLAPPTSSTAPRAKVEPRLPGPCLAGPVAIRDAMPGDTLEIRIQHVLPASWGWTYAGKGMGNAAMNVVAGLDSNQLALITWDIESDASGRGTARSSLGTTVPLRPFPGTIGLAPARAPDEAACAWTPRDCGGNMDCRELIAGSTLYLPVMVPGALLSAGDGHAAQGDGEISGTAIETPLTALDLQVILRKDLRIVSPRIYSRDAWITPAFAPTLDQAAYLAAARMIELISAELGCSRDHAAALASSCVSLHITQVVNPLVGVHAIWKR